MADFDLSLAITADGSQAVAATQAEGAALDQLTAAEGRASAAANNLKAASAGAEAAQTRAAASAVRLGQATERAAQAATVGTASVGQMRMGSMMLGQQIQDVGMQLALGTNFMRVFAMQAGQTALAVQNMTGGANKFASFIGGPWGSLILAGVSVVALLGSELLNTEKAIEQAKAGSDGLSDAQGVLGQIFDLTTGKIERQNEVLILNARLMAQTMRAEAIADRARAEGVMDKGGRIGFGGAVAGMGQDLVSQLLRRGGPSALDATGARGNQIDQLLQGMRSGRLSKDQAFQAAGRLDYSGLAVTQKDIQQAIIDSASADLKSKTADEIDKALNTKTLPKDLMRPTTPKKPKKPKDTSAIEEFGEDAANRIRDLGAAFQDIPPQQERVNRAMEQLDDLLDDIQRKKPPGFEKLLEQGKEARSIIEQGINRPYQDFMKTQEESLNVQRLVAQGRNDEAQALQYIQQLEAAQGPMDKGHRDAVLATVQALKAEQREAELLHQIQARQLEAVNGIKEAVRGMFDLQSGGRGLLDLPKRLFDSFNQYFGDYWFDKIFGDSFRKLEDQVSGNNIVADAAERAKDAFDNAARSVAKLGDAAEAASSPNAAPSSSQQDSVDQTITVHGNRLPTAGIPTEPTAFFGFVINKLLVGLDVFSEKAAASISKAVGSAIQGAMLGNMGAQLIGQKAGVGSSLGGAVGGLLGKEAGKSIATAIGGTLGKTLGNLAGPLGSILGGIAGSMVSKLMTGTQKGSVKLGSGGNAVTGNAYGKQLSQLAQGFDNSLQSIADQLGASVGDYSVSIGIRNGKFKVDPTGKGNTKGPGVIGGFGDDQGAAVGAALADAIADGAIQGISPAMQKAMRKYGSDVNRAVAEALKVQEVEQYLADFGNAYAKTFRDFEKQAAQRLKIANAYGLDMVQLEKDQAEDRKKVFKDALSQQIGSLQDLLNDLRVGDLFQGTPSQQREMILSDIQNAQMDIAAGVEGATQHLADLERQLLQVSLDAYGTAGPEYESDLQAARQAAEQAIAAETERARQAQENAIASLNAQQSQVQLQDETNDLLAKSNSFLAAMASSMGVTATQLAASSASTARQTSLTAA